jgi:hypothetical protein
MSDATTAGMSRRQLLEAAGTAAAALAAASPAAPAEAAQPTVEMVPLKLTLNGPMPQGIIIPVQPPLFFTTQYPLTAPSSILGRVTSAGHDEGYLDINGQAAFVNGEGALTGDSGDALFMKWAFLPHLNASTGVTEATGAFVVTGGKGKYSNTSGSGTLSIVFDSARNQTTFVFDGMLAVRI